MAYSLPRTYISFISVIAIHKKKAALNKLHNNRQKWGNDSLYVHLKLIKAVPTK